MNVTKARQVAGVVIVPTQLCVRARHLAGTKSDTQSTRAHTHAGGAAVGLGGPVFCR
jgi:hypothetical protein